MSTLAEVPPVKHKHEVLDQAVIRFAGDSGDGMQITGSQFTNTVALYGNDIATFPDYPAEIRAPAGTIPGVSGFQIHFSSNDVYTPGDSVDVLIAMNPAALKMNIADLKANGILIVNSDSFTENDLRKAQMTSNPLEDHSLDKFRLFSVELERLTRRSLEHLGLDAKSMDRCKNFFALGMCYWLYNRSMEPTVRWIEDKFKNKPLLVEANKLALKAGYSYCEATEAFQVSYEIPPAQLTPGLYRNLSGNQALALGFVTASQKSGLTLFQGSYPITPASDILHELSHVQRFRRDDVSGRRRNRGHHLCDRRGIRRRAGYDHDLRSGHGAEDRSHGPCRRGRIPAGHLRHPARRTFHRLADQDRAGRSVAGAVRPQLRSADSDAGGIHARRLLLGCHRSLPHRDQIHGSGHHSLGRLSGKWRRALADSESDEIPRFPVKFATDPDGFCLTSATRKPWRGRGPFRERLASNIASAASKSRTSPATSTTSR